MDQVDVDPGRNIFWKAAMTGEVTYPTIRTQAATSLASTEGKEAPPKTPPPGQSGRGKQKQTKRLRYTPVEDHMILQAVEIHGRNWYNVLKFLNEHRDVLGKEACQKYKDVELLRDKKAHERIRKRVNILQEKHDEKHDRFV